MPGNRPVLSADTSFLVHVFQADALDLVLAMHEITVTDHVVDEVAIPWEVDALQGAIKEGHVRVLPINAPGELDLFAALRRRMGDGEAAAIVAAKFRDFLLATDDQEPPVKRAVETHLGGRVLSLQDLFRNAIEKDLISVAEADRRKQQLADNYGYALPLRSFADIVRRPLS